MITGALISILLLMSSAVAGKPCSESLRRPPLVRQKTNHTCGPASLRSILLYHGYSLSEEELAMRMGTNCEIGTTAKSLIKELKKYGFLGHLKTHASVKELETHLKNGSFPILHVQSDGESHWVVLIDIDKKYLTVMDPWKASSYRKVTRLGLNQIWYGEEGHNAAILW